MLAQSALLPIAHADTASLKDYAHQVAIQYDLNEPLFFAVINCESGWDPKVPSKIVRKDGTLEPSFGIAQFNLENPPIPLTKEQALDPYWSLDTMGRLWSEGQAKHWSCYTQFRAKYGNRATL